VLRDLLLQQAKALFLLVCIKFYYGIDDVLGFFIQGRIYADNGFKALVGW
jgi:hypothetical protein